jgi:tellurium resistance protein TerD
MAVNLTKGQKVSLTKDNPSLRKITVGLGWDVNRYDGGNDFDLDASAFLLGANGKVPGDAEFIFYGNASHASGGVTYGGDNRTGAGEGDDEQIFVDLTLIPANIEKVDFTVTIYDADVRRQNFGQVNNAYVRIVDDATGKELVRYDLEEDFSIETALVVGEIYRKDGEWRFNAIGSGYQGGLEALCRSYGVNV